MTQIEKVKERPCKMCNGTGVTRSYDFETFCSNCNGTGIVVVPLTNPKTGEVR